MQTNLANVLTFARIALIPIVMVAFYAQSSFGRWVAACAFGIACITDFLDGYVARTWQQTTPLGRFLDPVADKLLVASTLFLLASFDQISRYSLLPALIILWREILVMGLRETLYDQKITLPVGSLGKWKTVLQMASIALLLIGDAARIGPVPEVIGEGLLWVAAILTVVSGYHYFQQHLKHFRE